MRWLLVTLLVACGSDKEPGKRERPPEKSKDLAPLFTGATVTLPPEVATATFGAPQAGDSYVSSKTLDRVSYNLDYSHAEKKLEKVSVSASAPLEPLMTKQWGPPIETAKGAAFWFDAKAGVRAWLPEFAKGERASFSRYASLESLLGPTGFALAFAAGKPLIGATLDELKAAWGGKLCDFAREAPEVAKSIEEYRTSWNGLWHDKPHRLRLCLPLPRFVDENTPYGDLIDVGRMGQVEHVTLSFQTGGAAAIVAQATTFLDAKFGTPTLLTDSTGVAERWYFDPATRQRAIARFTPQSFSVDVGRYSPVAELLAADAPGVLSVATKSMPGGTPAQIAKEDPAHFNPHGSLPRLVFPASDFGREELEIDLESWDKAPTTYGYRVVLFHTDNEAAGDAVFALLEKKLGKAKRDPLTKDQDLYFDWTAKGGAKVVGRRASQQWSIEVTRE